MVVYYDGDGGGIALASTVEDDGAFHGANGQDYLHPSSLNPAKIPFLRVSLPRHKKLQLHAVKIRKNKTNRPRKSQKNRPRANLHNLRHNPRNAPRYLP